LGEFTDLFNFIKTGVLSVAVGENCFGFFQQKGCFRKENFRICVFIARPKWRVSFRGIRKVSGEAVLGIRIFFNGSPLLFGSKSNRAVGLRLAANKRTLGQAHGLPVGLPPNSCRKHPPRQKAGAFEEAFPWGNGSYKKARTL
jgi:hypothetical protein